MIYAAPADQIVVPFDGWEPGHVGTVGWRLVAANGSTVVARTTAGVSEPSPGDYRVSLAAPGGSGVYYVRFDNGHTPLTDIDQDEEMLTVQGHGPLVVADQNYLPTVQQVALHLMARTRGEWGTEEGTFNDLTRPTDVQVMAIIEQAATHVADMVGDTVPDALRDDAADLVAVRAAMQIELDFFPEEVNTNRSVYPQLLAEYEAGITRLQRAVEVVEAGGDPTGPVVDPLPGRAPSYSFPDPSITLDRRM